MQLPFLNKQGCSSMKTQKILFLAALTSLFFGCAHKSKSTDQGNAPELTSAAMNFAASGSDSGQIEGLSSINFSYDNDSLDKNAKALLSKDAEWIKSHQKIKIVIE